MPEYLTPGVFIEEIERGLKTIEGVPTSIVAFLGETARGPVKPAIVTDYGSYLRCFGNVFAAGKYMPNAVSAFFANGGRRCYIARIVGANNQTATATLGAFTVSAVGPGAAGNRIWVRLEDSTTQLNGSPVGFRLRVFDWDSFPQGGAPFDPVADPDTLPRPVMSEDFDDIRTDPAHADYHDKRINSGNSSLITIQLADNTPPPGVVLSQTLGAGADGDPITVADYQGLTSNIDDRRGLAALEMDSYEDVALIHAPAAPPDVISALITHCERNRFRFAVIDSPANVADFTTLNPRKYNDTKYAAFYYPWLYTSDPLTGQRIKVPPGGSVCGIYARSDNTRGVWKTPANEPVTGALDLEYDIDQDTQELLNPRGVNVIRRFPGRGIRVWGGRTLTSDPQWKYVSVHRLCIFIEASIDRSMQWAVFEPNDQILWDRVKRTVALFLRTLWREGALVGMNEEEAYFVFVGRETMTEDDILNGRLIIRVGLAPVRPAEFVIIRIIQKTKEAS